MGAFETLGLGYVLQFILDDKTHKTVKQEIIKREQRINKYQNLEEKGENKSALLIVLSWYYLTF